MQLAIKPKSLILGYLPFLLFFPALARFSDRLKIQFEIAQGGRTVSFLASHNKKQSLSPKQLF